eukprot:TRINITY_DN74668_c0_g1_i1.p1 TRINITY_DN74668_c0_g1~~TRINITY_DN74668_c0_g1_i1.p1  ORF type:complete len:261 (-),score=70.31 TRINITY_DN74668_c0_g1_i1:174-908(-)
MAAEGAGENGWLVDMVIQFMHSPTWNDPINAFTSEKCTSFDNFQEEMKHEYMEIHAEFRNLIDNLLTAHLLQVDISPEDFEQQVMDSNLADDPRMQRVVSQLVAAEDFVAFQKMMVEQHIKMQQQAEGNYQELSPEDESAANDAAIAAAIAADAAAAEGAIAQHRAAAAAAAAAAPAPAAPAAPAPPAPPSPSAAEPSAAEERAFGAAGGSYGRAAVPAGGKKPASNEKAAAIRKALLSGLRPR